VFVSSTPNGRGMAGLESTGVKLTKVVLRYLESASVLF
jgi:hypothetical protein